MISYNKTKSKEYVLDQSTKKPGGEEVDDINTAEPRACDTSSEHENRNKTTTNMLEKVKVPNIVQLEKETNQDTIKPLPWADFMENGFGISYQCDDISTATTITYDTSSDHENIGNIITDMKEKQVTTLAGKEDDTESTATKTTATLISSCELEWDEYSCDVMMELQL